MSVDSSVGVLVQDWLLKLPLHQQRSAVTKLPIYVIFPSIVSVFTTPQKSI